MGLIELDWLLFGRRASLFSCRLLDFGVLAGCSLLLIRSCLPLRGCGGVGLQGGLSYSSLAIFRDFYGCGLIFLELGVLFGELSVLLASCDSDIFVCGGASLASLKGCV